MVTVSWIRKLNMYLLNNPRIFLLTYLLFVDSFRTDYTDMGMSPGYIPDYSNPDCNSCMSMGYLE